MNGVHEGKRVFAWDSPIEVKRRGPCPYPPEDLFSFTITTTLQAHNKSQHSFIHALLILSIPSPSQRVFWARDPTHGSKATPTAGPSKCVLLQPPIAKQDKDTHTRPHPAPSTHPSTTRTLK